MAKKDIVIDGVSFSREFLEGHNSEGDFITAMNDKTYAHLFVGDNRDAKLKNVYALGQPKDEPVAAKAAPAMTAQEKPKSSK